MRKRRFWIIIAALVGLAALIFLVARVNASKKQNPYEEINRIKGNIEAALGDEWTQQVERRVTPIYYSGPNESTLIYYVITTTYYCEAPDLSELGDVFFDVIDTSTAENSRSCKVCDLDAMIYEKGDRSFLCWTVSDECSLAIEYSPEVVSEADAIRMAESVPASSGENNG